MMHRAVPIRSRKASLSRVLPEILEAVNARAAPFQQPGDTTACRGRATVCGAVMLAVDQQARALQPPSPQEHRS
jgi:hypothetical protein